MTLPLLLSLLNGTARAGDCTTTFGGSGADLAAEVSALADGSVLCLEAGTYSLPSRLNLTNRTLTIRGEGSGVTTLQRTLFMGTPGEDEWVINVAGGTITLEDLTVSGREQIRAIGVENGSSAARLKLYGVEITAARRSLEGAGIRLRSNMHLEVYDSVFDDNLATSSDSRGGHIYHEGGSGTVLIEDAIFTAGQARRGGAIAMDGGTLTVRRSTFEGNRSTRTGTVATTDFWGGGAILLNMAVGTIEDSAFNDNQSTGSGGAILVHKPEGRLTVLRTNFADNTATRSGGHVMSFEATTSITQARFRRGSGVGGGAVACNKGSCAISDSGFWFNVSGSADDGRGGGGVYLVEGSLTATRNLFCGNDVAVGGRTVSENGGGAIMTHTSSPATLRNNVYMGNSTNGTGGALFLRDDGDTSSYETAAGNQGGNGCGIYGRGSANHNAIRGVWAFNVCGTGGNTFIGHSGSDRVRFSWNWFWSNTVSANFGTRTTDEGNNSTTSDPTLPTLPAFPLSTAEDCRVLYDFKPDSAHPLYRDELTSLPAAQRYLGATGGPNAGVIDADGDGWSWLFDCDDTDDVVTGPGPLYADLDGDGYGAGASIGTGCPGPGQSTRNDDCDDDDPAINPGATEIPGDGVDQDCDDLELCYEDADGDGWRTATPALTDVIGCDAAPWALASLPSADCDDDDAFTFPGATERCDGIKNDCDASALPADEADLDGDRYVVCAFDGSTWRGDPAIVGGLDCDDDDPFTYPGATERCDGVINDCRASILPDDEADLDGDRYVVCAYDAATWRGASTILGGLDCDDDDPASYPGAPELVADGVDQDCDGVEVCYQDRDDDGWRTSEVSSVDASDRSVNACARVGVALATEPSGDCDDDDPDTYPGAPQIVGDGKDQTCSGEETCYQDLDGDGWRTDLTTVTTTISCVGGGLALASMPRVDCDDDDPDTFPGATEIIADGKDQSCDGTEICYQDRDDDGWRTTLTTVTDDLSCAGDGLALATVPTLDCDDDDPDTYPGATEIIADGKDQSCDGTEICYQDLDGDLWRTELTTVSADTSCTGDGLALASVPTLDCDDENEAINPGADEIWYDGVDQDCDGWSDFDQDFDGFDSDAHERLDGTFGDDCDDLEPAVNPDALEIWYDGVDQDCDGWSDFDQDFDGYDAKFEQQPDGAFGDDCDDLDDTIFPGVRGLTADCEQTVEQDGSRALPPQPPGATPGPVGCACEATTAGSPIGWLAAIGLLGALWRRRRAA
jgi:MYXO-CTERM domain-containing protein